VFCRPQTAFRRPNTRPAALPRIVRVQTEPREESLAVAGARWVDGLTGPDPASPASRARSGRTNGAL